jgi:hypothetical protein
MRRLAVATVIALLGGGCAAGAPQCNEVSYNRRELPPGPGVLSGPSGGYTIYRRGKDDKRQECHPSAHQRGDGEAPEGQADGAGPATSGAAQRPAAPSGTPDRGAGTP